MDIGKYVMMRCGGIPYYYLQCPHCGKLNHIYSQKPDKVQACYYCTGVFIQPHSKQAEEWE